MKSSPRYRGRVVRRSSQERLDPKRKQMRKERLEKLERDCILECVKEKARKLKSVQDKDWKGWNDVKQALDSCKISTSSGSEFYYGSDDGSCRSGGRSNFTLAPDAFVAVDTRILEDSFEDFSMESSIQDTLSKTRSFSISSKPSRNRLPSRYSTTVKGKYYVEMSRHDLTGSVDNKRRDTAVSDLKHAYHTDGTTPNDLIVEVGSAKAHFRRNTSSLINSRSFANFHNRTAREVESNWPGRKKIKLMKEDESGRIVRRFSNWAAKRGLKSPAIDQETLTELFQFENADSPAVRSLTTGIRELHCVPNEIPNCPPEHKGRACLYRHVLFDQLDHDRKDKGICFMSRNPSYRKKAAQSPTDVWFHTSTIPPDLLDTSALFKPLINGNPSTIENFVSWIIEHPEERVPSYLSKSGLIDKIVSKIRKSKKFTTLKRSRIQSAVRRRSVSQVLNEEAKFLSRIPRLREILQQTIEGV